MPIKVSCQCGQSFAVKDEYAGKTLKCPKCQAALPIPRAAGTGQPATAAAAPAAKAPARPATPAAPAAPNLSSLFDEAGMTEHKGTRCPQCGTPLSNPNAILCTKCGFHLQSGQKLEGAKVYKAGERGHAEAADSLLDRAAKQIEIDKEEEKRVRKAGMPGWVIFLALCGLVGFVYAMFALPKERAFYITGNCICGFGALMSGYYGLRMVIAAWQESAVVGLLYMFMPFYALYFLVTRWERVGSLFIMNLIYSFVAGIGIGMVAIAPMLKKEENPTEGTSWRVPTEVRLVVSHEFSGSYSG